MALDDLPRQSKSESCPLIILSREKGVKEPPQIVRRDPMPVVCHNEAKMVVALSNSKRDRTALRKCVQSIAN